MLGGSPPGAFTLGGGNVELRTLPTVDLPVTVLIDPHASTITVHAPTGAVTVDPARSTVTVDT